MPVDPAQLLIFFPAALALNLTPGNDMLYCLTQGVRAGPRAGVAASLGIMTGSLIHSLIAAFGLAALLRIYPVSFEIIRWAGVGYLLWLSVQAIRQPVEVSSRIAGKSSAADRANNHSDFNAMLTVWRQGVIVNLLNPKVAIFILALVPQFVDLSRGSTVLQFLIFCALLNIAGTPINALVGYYSGTIGRALAANKTVATVFTWLSALVFVILAARIALQDR